MAFCLAGRRWSTSWRSWPKKTTNFGHAFDPCEIIVLKSYTMLDSLVSGLGLDTFNMAFADDQEAVKLDGIGLRFLCNANADIEAAMCCLACLERSALEPCQWDNLFSGAPADVIDNKTTTNMKGNMGCFVDKAVIGVLIASKGLAQSLKEPLDCDEAKRLEEAGIAATQRSQSQDWGGDFQQVHHGLGGGFFSTR